MSDGNGALPDGWEKLKLADVATHSTEKAEPNEFGESSYIGLEHIEGGSNRIIANGDASTVKSTKAVFRSGDVRYGKLRPYLKKVCRPVFDGDCSTDILVFPQQDHLDNGYLLNFLSQQSTADFATQNANGINLPRISPKNLGEIELPVPPLAEQRRIESLQERSSRARRALSEVGPLLEQFRQSVLRAAFSGRLTDDWRAARLAAREGEAPAEPHPGNAVETTNGSAGASPAHGTLAPYETAHELLERIRTERRHRWEQSELAKYEVKGKQPPENWQDKYTEPEPVDESELPELPDGWCWIHLDELADVQLGQRRAPEFSKVDEYPYIRAANITWKGLDINDVKAMGFALPDSLFLEDGDVLLNEASGSKTEVGKPALWRGEIANCCFQATVLRLRSRTESVRPEWLDYNRLFDALLVEYAAKAPGLGIIHLTAKLMRRWPIPLAPVEEQDEIVSRLLIAIDQIDGLEASAGESESALTQLDQSILAKAFRGELVPQEARDEPASELLARIRTTREAGSKVQRTRKTKAGSK